jgi:hypothetical protein
MEKITSSTSALPHRLETDLLPCFATLAPAAAAIMDALTVQTVMEQNETALATLGQRKSILYRNLLVPIIKTYAKTQFLFDSDWNDLSAT